MRNECTVVEHSTALLSPLYAVLGVWWAFEAHVIHDHA